MRSAAERIIAGSPREHRVAAWCIVWCILMLFLDQCSKILVENSLKLHVPHTIIPGWFDFTYAVNRGAAWSILEGYGWLLLLVGAAVLVAALIFLRQLADGWPERYWAIFTVLSGVIGNSIDRIWRGAVVDFISLHYQEVYHYPIFNVADCAICVGIGVFLLSCFLRPERKNS